MDKMDTRYVFFAIISLIFIVGQATSDEADELAKECNNNNENCTVIDNSGVKYVAKIALFKDKIEISLGALKNDFVGIAFLNKNEEEDYEGFACAKDANYIVSDTTSTPPKLTEWTNDGTLKVEDGSAGSKAYCKLTLTQDVHLVKQTVQIGHVYYLKLFGGTLAHGTDPTAIDADTKMFQNRYYLSSASTKAIAVTLVVTTIALINLL